MVQDGEALFDMRVSNSDEELFQEDEEMVESWERSRSRSLTKSSSRDKIIDYSQLDKGNLPSNASQESNSKVVDSMNNNVVQMEEGEVSTPENESHKNSGPVSLDQMSHNEGFMENLAQFMIQKGYFMRHDDKQQESNNPKESNESSKTPEKRV